MKKTLCVAAVFVLLLCPLLSLGEDSLCLPWFNLTWDGATAETGESTGYIYVGVYPCRYELDFSLWPESLSGVLEPVDAERIEGLGRKAVNDCWSFYGVYPEEPADDTFLFRKGGNSVCLVVEENDIRFTVVSEEVQ